MPNQRNDLEQFDDQLEGMPAAITLTHQLCGDEVVVSYGGKVLAVYERADRGMRNLAIVALTKAGVPGVKVAALFAMRPEHVSRLRRLAHEGGSAALLPPMGRPASLDAAGKDRVFALAAQGLTGVTIARRVGVSPSLISRLLASHPKPGPGSEPLTLDLDDSASQSQHDAPEEVAEDEPENVAEDEPTGVEPAGRDVTGEPEAGPEPQRPEPEPGCESESHGKDLAAPLARISDGGRPCAYAGAMLLHGFLDRVGVGAVLGALPAGPARRYDPTGVLLATTFAFALGAASAEGTKHLLGADAGALAGLNSFPHLRTLRPRLAALAEASDPLGVQAALARNMLSADEHDTDVFFIDDHFVAYTGTAPVGKGWNTRRRHAEPGREDTLIVDAKWRAICFASGPASGLSKTMFAPLAQLRQIRAGRPMLLGFDRGGAYPKVFAQLRDAGVDWVTYRRAPLAVPAGPARRRWVVTDGHRHYLQACDELVELTGLGQVRQISVFEGEKVILQILTSDRKTGAARLARTLKGRWCIENTFKYLEDHHGVGMLCDYRKILRPDTVKVKNPARTLARETVNAASREVAELQRRIGEIATTSSGTPLAATNTTLSELTGQLQTARAELAAARSALAPVPAKLPANTINPDATRAFLPTRRRALQMVCRLLAYNAELDLARALDVYLADPNEYRAITRNLLHQPGHITYTPTAITVAIRRPDAPRIATALNQLIDKLNSNPPHLAGDHRPISYQIEPTPTASTRPQPQTATPVA